MRLLPLADDCGLSPAVTAGIFRCLDAGVLRGASVMACGRGAAEAAENLGRRLAADPSLRIGVHLNLLEGRCAAPWREVPLLAWPDGRFRYGLLRLLLDCRLARPEKRRSLRSQIEREFHAQAEFVLNAVRRGAGEAVPVSLYVDGHLHVHALPLAAPALESLLRARPVRHVRLPFEPRHLPPAGPRLLLAGALRRELLAFWAGPLRTLLDRLGVAFPRFFVGGFCSGEMTMERLRAALAAVRARHPAPDDEVELMFHPGGFGGRDTREENPDAAYAGFYASPHRQQEEAMLLSPEFSSLLAAFGHNTRPRPEPHP